MMHDIDRTLAELEAEDDAGLLGATEQDTELEDDAWREHEDEDEDDDGLEDDEGDEVVLDDDEELELATELLDASDDEELEQFLGKLFRRVGRGLRRIGRRGRRLFKRGVVRRLGRALKKVAKRALPLAGAAAGGAFGGPTGAMVGGRVAPGVGSILGLELEGLAPEEQELEAARRFVRMASAATSSAARRSRTAASPQRIVRASMEKAARRHAPGLLRPAVAVEPAPEGPPAGGRTGGRTSGRWVRRGKTIVLLGA